MSKTVGDELKRREREKLFEREDRMGKRECVKRK